jgi:predicted RNase H-like HicB family nuclease
MPQIGRHSHGNDEREVFNGLCEIIDEMVQLYQEDGKQLPPPISGKKLVNELQIVA